MGMEWECEFKTNVYLRKIGELFFLKKKYTVIVLKERIIPLE